ncbi:hypothetical protein ACLOJK_020810 [Asimina triloba]
MLVFDIGFKFRTCLAYSRPVEIVADKGKESATEKGIEEVWRGGVLTNISIYVADNPVSRKEHSKAEQTCARLKGTIVAVQSDLISISKAHSLLFHVHAAAAAGRAMDFLAIPSYPGIRAMDFLAVPASSPLLSLTKPSKISPSPLNCSAESDTPSISPVRRPQLPPLPKMPTPTPTPAPAPASPLHKISRNPLKTSTISSQPRNPAVFDKLWLSSKLSPPPPTEPLPVADIPVSPPEDDPSPLPPAVPVPEFRQEGKLFVGNLPLWIKKNQIAEFFRQFGPVKNVVLIKGHDDAERNVGYCFVLYGGPTAASAAAKAVEFDGVEFHGRVLTVRLDDGRRLKARAEERSRWVAGEGGSEKEHRSKWHEERELSCKEFRRVLETEPENWQAVVSAFERVKKPSRGEFGLMVKFYARRGDKHNARATFESMRARGIEPSSYVYTKWFISCSLVNAYAVARDMRGALSCVEEMKDEGIEMTVVTYSVLIKGFNNIGDAEAADNWFREAKLKLASLNAIIYSNVVYAQCQAGNMDRAEELVRELEEVGIDAPIILYHTMMDGYTEVRNEEKCLIVFERLKVIMMLIIASLVIQFLLFLPTSRPAAVSLSLCVDKRIEMGKKLRRFRDERIKREEKKGLEEIWEEIRDEEEKSSGKIEKNIRVVVMGKVSKALEVSKSMALNGIKHNSKTYSMLISGYVNQNDFANAFAVFEDMLKAGLKPDAVLYNNIIDAFCKMGNIDRAIRIVDEMKMEKHRPSPRTFTPIIRGLAKLGDMKRALEIVNMMRTNGCIPTVETYNVLIHGLVGKQQMERALETLNEMLLAGISPNECTYTTIMQGYASLGDTGKAFEYFTKIKDEGLKLDRFTYEALLKACCKSGRMQSALAVTREMSAQNIPRDTFVYNILIDGYESFANYIKYKLDLQEDYNQTSHLKGPGLALAAVGAYPMNGLDPAAVNWEYVSSGSIRLGLAFVCRNTCMPRATKIIEEMEAVGIKPNVKTFTTIIHGWARASMLEKALKCFEEMKLAGLKPDKAVYHCLMTSLLSRAKVAEEHVYSRILGICKEMIELELSVDMRTAIHWSKCLHKMERTGGELTEALQKTFPPAWNSYENLNANFSQMDNDDADRNSDDDFDYRIDDSEDEEHADLDPNHSDDDDDDDDYDYDGHKS